MNYVLDAGDLIAWLRLEPGALAVRRPLKVNPGTCYVHAINLCEVYCGFRRANGEAVVDRAVHMVAAAGIITREDMDSALWRVAGRLKSDIVRVSLADCIALAFAQRIDAEFVTTDHAELDAVAMQAPVLGLRVPKFIR